MLDLYFFLKKNQKGPEDTHRGVCFVGQGICLWESTRNVGCLTWFLWSTTPLQNVNFWLSGRDLKGQKC